MSKPTLLIFGSVGPCTSGVSAATVHTARVLSDSFNVTVCIGDEAPVVPAKQQEAIQDYGIFLIRMRKLRESLDAYTDHKRLYVMGDSFESLFALRTYEEAPAPVLCVSQHLNRLLQAGFATSKGWPESYANYLFDRLDQDGYIIARGLLQHRRISDALSDELDTIDDAVDGVSSLPFLDSQHLVPAPLVPVFSGPDVAATDKNSSPLIAYTDTGCAEEVVSSLKTLSGAVAEARYVRITPADIHMPDIIKDADVVLDLTEASNCPHVAAAAISAGKPLVFSEFGWSSALGSYGLPVPHSKALHRATVALAAFVIDADLRKQHEAMAPVDWCAQKQQQALATLQEKIRAPQAPLQLKKRHLQSSPASENVTTKANELAEGPKRPIALIGAVPPKPLIEKLFPQVEWQASPRFATPAVRQILCAADPDHAPNRIAALGYDTPLVAMTDNQTSDSSGAAEITRGWPELKKELRDIDEALSFGCALEGAICADDLLVASEAVKYQLALSFSAIDAARPMSNYEEQCGLFWHLNLVEHHVDCLLVAGLRGKYILNSKTSTSSLLVSSEHGTYALSSDEPVVLKANEQGVLSFKLLSIDGQCGGIQKCEFLTKTLADSDLNLEWLGHG